MTTRNLFTPSRPGSAPVFHPHAAGDGMLAPIGQPLLPPPIASVSLLPSRPGGGGGPTDYKT
jgi:hypothetical protein